MQLKIYSIGNSPSLKQNNFLYKPIVSKTFDWIQRLCYNKSLT